MGKILDSNFFEYVCFWMWNARIKEIAIVKFAGDKWFITQSPIMSTFSHIYSHSYFFYVSKGQSLNITPTIISVSHQNSRLHTGARVNVVLLIVKLTTVILLPIDFICCGIFNHQIDIVLTFVVRKQGKLCSKMLLRVLLKRSIIGLMGKFSNLLIFLFWR